MTMIVPDRNRSPSEDRARVEKERDAAKDASKSLHAAVENLETILRGFRNGKDREDK